VCALLRPEPRQNNNLERNGDSKECHFALARISRSRKGHWEIEKCGLGSDCRATPVDTFRHCPRRRRGDGHAWHDRDAPVGRRGESAIQLELQFGSRTCPMFDGFALGTPFPFPDGVTSSAYCVFGYHSFFLRKLQPSALITRLATIQPQLPQIFPS
jgi:hypothetical protein